MIEDLGQQLFVICCQFINSWTYRVPTLNEMNDHAIVQETHFAYKDWRENEFDESLR